MARFRIPVRVGIPSLPVPPAGTFLMPIRKVRKNRLRGGADREIFPTSSKISPPYPDFEPPSPKYPFRPLRVSETLKIFFNYQKFRAMEKLGSEFAVLQTPEHPGRIIFSKIDPAV